LFGSGAGALKDVIAKCVKDASVRDICDGADKFILEETSKIFKKEKEMKKGNVTRNTLHNYKPSAFKYNDITRTCLTHACSQFFRYRVPDVLVRQPLYLQLFAVG
jgi:hypothetical protein